jgi:hypothetical protein
MKAIQTYYKDHYFRSRLEARWAVFFDAIGLKWIYEMEGYKLNNGQMYLPDFYFPELLCFGEVKATEDIPDEELSKVIELGKVHRILLLIGLPHNDPMKIYSPAEFEGGYLMQFVRDSMWDDKTHKYEQYWRFWWNCPGQREDRCCYDEAIKKAKQARF